MGENSKAIATAITGLLAVAAQFGLNTDWATPTTITAVATLVGTAWTWWVANTSA